jgi:DUF4097 and DUF4098 domain-containing protein YvlB
MIAVGYTDLYAESWLMNSARRYQTILAVAVGLLFLLSTLVKAQEVGQVTYKLGHKILLSITNPCGPITIKPSSTNEISVRYASYDKSVSFDHQRHGHRVTLACSSEHLRNNIAEYKVGLPRGASVMLFAAGPIHVEGLSGDITIETVHSPAEIRNIEGAYLRTKTIDGTITVKGARKARIYLHSVNGPINISDAQNSWVEADSTSGRIEYDGDPGIDGEFRLTSHSGDLEVSIPSSASVDIRTRSAEFGQLRENLVTPTTGQGTSFTGSAIANRSHFNLRSLTGRIHLKRP